MLHLIVPVLLQQDLILECKPQVDWSKVAVVKGNGAYLYGVNAGLVLSSVDDALTDQIGRASCRERVLMPV